MNALAAPSTTPPVAQRDFHQRLATATRRRRQAAGMYARPTKAQRDALARSYAVGYSHIVAADLLLLSTHPHLHEIQRADYLARYQAAQAA